VTRQEERDILVAFGVVAATFTALALGPNIFSYILVCLALIYLLVRS